MLGDPFYFREKLLPELAKRSEALQIATNGQESGVNSQESAIRSSSREAEASMEAFFAAIYSVSIGRIRIYKPC